MPANEPRETATIVQFPAGGRAGLKAQRAVKDRFADMPTIAVGSSWYHDEAVREAADPVRKN